MMDNFKKYLPWLLFSCKKTSELIDKSYETNLSFAEKATLFYHKTACRTCYNYKKQSKIIDNTFEKYAFEIKSNQEMSSNKKENLIMLLNQFED